MNAIHRPSASERYAWRITAAITSVALVATCALPTTYALAEESSNANQPQAQQSGGTPPAAPDGEAGGQMGTPPDGEGGGGANTQQFDYPGLYSATLTADGEDQSTSDETLTATESLANAALAQNGGTLDLRNVLLNKSGDANDGDSCNFYGVNSIALSVGEGSRVAITDSQLEASSEGSNGVFATDGATAYVNNSSISTTAGNSRGLDATYGGTIVASQVSASTQGDHSAGIATDRGGGYVSAANSSFETAGSGSPVLYSTGCIEVDSISGTSTGSQVAAMEGLNTISISNSTLESTITGTTGSDPVANGVIIYQSTSGDAETATGERALFQASDSTLTAAIQSGSMFYLTNTAADIVLSNTTLNFDTDAANLLTVAGNDSNNWGSAGSNGADVTLTGINQVLEGDISVDAISQLGFYLTQGTSYTGAISQVENASGGSGNGQVDVVVDANSTWTVTGDSTVSNLSVAEGGQVVDAEGNAVSIVAGGQTVVKGGTTTVTVSGAYSTQVDTSDAGSIAQASIDRTGFDEYYGIDTTFGSNAGASDEGSEEETQESNGGFFEWLASSVKSLLGL